MPKKDTDTDKWKTDKWFRHLPWQTKYLCLYLYEVCDWSGLWEIDLLGAAQDTGIPRAKIGRYLEPIKQRYITIENKWIWIYTHPKQQGNFPLNPKNNAHVHIIRKLTPFAARCEKVKKFLNGETLNNREILGATEGLMSPYGKGKGNGNGKGNGKGKGKGGIVKGGFSPPTVGEVQRYCEENNYQVNAVDFVRYYSAADWHDQTGKPVRNWKQKLIAVWAKRPKQKKCVHCNKIGVYCQLDNTGQYCWLCEDHKPQPKPLPAGAPRPQMKGVGDKKDPNLIRTEQHRKLNETQKPKS